MELLTAVRLVCGHMTGLPHVAHKVDAFLLGTGGAWTLERASECGQWCTTHEDAFEYDGVQVAFQYAAQHGQLEKLKWLHQHRRELCSPDILSCVVCNGHLEIAKWLVDKYPKQYFLDIRLAVPQMKPLDLATVRWAAFEFAWRDETACITWIYSEMGFAVSCSNLEMLESFYSIWIDMLKSQEEAIHDVTLDVGFIDAATRNGDLAMLQWIHAHENQGWSKSAMDVAAANGHLHVVQWLHRNHSEGCTTNAMDAAAAGGRLEVVQWLHVNRTEGCTTGAMDSAASNGHLEMVQWLHGNRTEGCTTQAMDLAAANGHLEIVQWLHDNRTEGCTIEAMDSAAQYGHVHVLKFLHTHRPEGCTTKAMDKAAKHGHLNAFKWLDENRSEGFSPDIHKWSNWKIQEYMARHTSYFTFGCFVDRLTDLKQFGIVESILREAGRKNVVSVESRYVVVDSTATDMISADS